MQIDWITTLAQAVNFLVLVWLLQHFLYRPILNAIERRREMIQERLLEAAAKHEEAEEAARSYQAKERELEAQREARLEAARKEAEQLKRELTEAAKQDVAAERDRWREELRSQHEALLGDFRRKLGLFITAAAHRALKALADSEIETQAAKRFAEELKSLGKADFEALEAWISEEGGAVVIESAQALDAAAKRNLTSLVRDQFGSQIDIDYRTDEDLVLGLRLRAGTWSVEWSLAGLLDDLNDVYEELTAADETPPPHPSQEAA